MADLRGAAFSKAVQKHAGRARERLLQNLGKVDKTTDEHFDEYLMNFNKQQQAAQKLYKEMKNYHQCLKAMQTSHKALMDIICEVYEPHWVEFDQVSIKSEVLGKKWEDFYDKINEQVIKPLSSYCDQFPDMSNKISKRGRKLLDYDSCRRHAQHLEQARKKEESKLLKAKEQLIEARNLYEMINAELHEELPALYDSRISFLVSNLQCLFLAETAFHSECAGVFNDLNDAIELLALESQKGIYATKKHHTLDNGTNELSSNQSKSATIVQSKSNSEGEIFPGGKSSEHLSCEISNKKSLDDYSGEKSLSGKSSDYLSCESSKIVSNENLLESNDSATEKNEMARTSSERVSSDFLESPQSDENEISDDFPTGWKNSAADSPTFNLPPGVLFKVKAAYKYIAEDADELSFDEGDIINVIDFEDPEQQEEGWLMGYKESDRQKGLFPANFTRPI